MGRWASHWPGVLQGMLRRHCRPQLTHVHTYFKIHTPSTMHAFHEPGRLWRNNGRKWKWELCEDLASIRRLSLTFQHSPALYYQLILLNTLSSKHNLFILYLPPSLHLYIKLSLLFLPFPLLSMDRGSWGMLHRKNAHSFASVLPLPSPVSLTIRSFSFPLANLSFFRKDILTMTQITYRVRNYSNELSQR